MIARSVLPLSIGAAWVAVDARDIVEILGPSAVVGLPGMPRLVPGVVAFRGRAAVVLDVGALVGAAAPLTPGESRARTVVVQAGASLVALPADAVREVLDLPAEAVASPTAEHPWAHGEARIFGAQAPILDVTRALPAFSSA